MRAPSSRFGRRSPPPPQQARLSTHVRTPLNRCSHPTSSPKTPTGAHPGRARQRSRPPRHPYPSRPAPLTRCTRRHRVRLSHLLSEVEHLADDVIVINQGRLVAHGSLAELQQSAALVRSNDSTRLSVALQQAGAITEAHGPDGLIVRRMQIEEIGERAFTTGIAVHELTPCAGSLEELFLNWTTDPSTTKGVIAS